MTGQKNVPTPETLEPRPSPADSGQLSDAELDAVAGGLNPQPLPPIERRLS